MKISSLVITPSLILGFIATRVSLPGADQKYAAGLAQKMAAMTGGRTAPEKK